VKRPICRPVISADALVVCCICLWFADCQSNVELIRQLLSERTILDHERRRFVAIDNINILAAATTPGLPGELRSL